MYSFSSPKYDFYNTLIHWAFVIMTILINLQFELCDSIKMKKEESKEEKTIFLFEKILYSMNNNNKFLYLFVFIEFTLTIQINRILDVSILIRNYKFYLNGLFIINKNLSLDKAFS